MLFSQITYQAIYDIDKRSQNLDSSLGIIMVPSHSRRVKTFSILDSAMSSDEEIDTNDIEFNNDDVELINDETELNNAICSNFLNKETKTDELEELSNDNIHNDIQLISIKSEKLDVDEAEYKFEGDLKIKKLSVEHWKRINLSEEEAVNEFRARAKNPKFLKAPYQCMLCFKGFSKNEMLKRHHQIKHSEVKTCYLFI